jgi:hypothetical protein
MFTAINVASAPHPATVSAEPAARNYVLAGDHRSNTKPGAKAPGFVLY